MKFYYFTWVDYEGMNRSRLFRNKKDAGKAWTVLNEDDNSGDAFLSDIVPYDLKKVNKDSIIRLFNQL
jgi:hypothetical protein